MSSALRATLLVGALFAAACATSGTETDASGPSVTFEPVPPTFEPVWPADPSSPTAPSIDGTEGGSIHAHPVLDPIHPGLALVVSPDDKRAALELIDEVRTAPRGRKDTYDRALFGQRWSDDTSDPIYGHDGCDTRNNILERDLADERHEPGTNDCVVVSGTYTSPFSGERQTFAKQMADAHHVDHVVALSYAWQMGASDWDADTRRDFANDPLNLIVVESSLNLAKGDSDPASWLPPYKDGRCAYAVRFAAVSVEYDLPNTPANKQMMLDQCQP